MPQQKQNSSVVHLRVSTLYQQLPSPMITVAWDSSVSGLGAHMCIGVPLVSAYPFVCNALALADWPIGDVCSLWRCPYAASKFYCCSQPLVNLGQRCSLITVVKLQPYADPHNNLAAKENAHKQISTRGKSVVVDFGIGVKPIPKSKRFSVIWNRL